MLVFRELSLCIGFVDDLSHINPRT
jgi:hypothetical protein